MMAEQKQTFATEIINEIAKQRNHWILAFCISLVGNIIQAAIWFFR